MLARAYLKKAPILIMDEPTSALDAENEERVIQDIVNNTPEQTVLIISHRNSSLHNLKECLFEYDRQLTSNFGDVGSL